MSLLPVTGAQRNGQNARRVSKMTDFATIVDDQSDHLLLERKYYR